MAVLSVGLLLKGQWFNSLLFQTLYANVLGHRAVALSKTTPAGSQRLLSKSPRLRQITNQKTYYSVANFGGGLDCGGLGASCKDNSSCLSIYFLRLKVLLLQYSFLSQPVRRQTLTRSLWQHAASDLLQTCTGGSLAKKRALQRTKADPLILRPTNRKDQPCVILATEDTCLYFWTEVSLLICHHVGSY